MTHTAAHHPLLRHSCAALALALSTILLAPLTCAASQTPAGAASSTAAPATPVSSAAAPSPVQTDDAPTAAANPTPKSASPVLAASAQPAGQDNSGNLRHWSFVADPDAYSIVGATSGLSFHNPMYVEPYTYSPSYNGRNSELVFQISLKLQLLRYPRDGALYAAYTQKSFWDVYDASDSRPFRETNYNPEVFYRYIPHEVKKWHHLGVDFGFEHNSNGQGLPDSRSWNRIYVAPFQAKGHHLLRFKLWWRIPQGDPNAPRTSSHRDDNPDIEDYYGYARVDFEQQFPHGQLLHIWGRYNPGFGRGAISVNYSFPGPGDHFFWGFFFFNGYGDSLLNYNHAITRVGLGIMLSR